MSQPVDFNGSFNKILRHKQRKADNAKQKPVGRPQKPVRRGETEKRRYGVKNP